MNIIIENEIVESLKALEEKAPSLKKELVHIQKLIQKLKETNFITGFYIDDVDNAIEDEILFKPGQELTNEEKVNIIESFGQKHDNSDSLQEIRDLVLETYSDRIVKVIKQ